MASITEHSVISTRFACYADSGTTDNLSPEEIAKFDQWTADSTWIGVGEDSGTGMCQITGEWGELFTLLHDEANA